MSACESDDEYETREGDSTLSSFYTANGDHSLNRTDHVVENSSFMSAISDINELERTEECEELYTTTLQGNTLTSDDIQAQLDELERKKSALIALARKSVNSAPKTVSNLHSSESARSLKLVDLNFEDSELSKSSESYSAIRHNESSDSDDGSEMLDRKEILSESGRELKKKLDQSSDNSSCSSLASKLTDKRSKPIGKAPLNSCVLTGLSDKVNKASTTPSVFDSYFAIKIKNPKISSTTFGDFSEGLKKIRVLDLRTTKVQSSGWVTMGIIIHREVKKSANGNSYMLWKLHDLKDCQSHPVKLLLFGECMKQHWKLQVGVCVALMSPEFADQPTTSNIKAKSNEITLKAFKPTQVVELGYSPDFGICRGLRNDGQPCGNFTNISFSEYCIYHAMSEARKLSSKRGTFSSTSSMPPLTKNRNPGLVTISRLPTNSVQAKAVSFPAGTINPSSSNALKKSDLKTTTKAEERATLGQIMNSRANLFGARNLMRLTSMNEEGLVNKANRQNKFVSMSEFINGQDEKTNEEVHGPQLGFGIQGLGDINLSNKSKRPDRDEAARLRAIAILKRKKDVAPGVNNKTTVKRSSGEETTSCKRSKLDAIENKDQVVELLKRKSIHEKEADKEEANITNKYLCAMEKKEKLETFVTECMSIKEVKVVSCKKCGYTSQKQSELCLRSGHVIYHHKAEKRFFKCSNCQRRTVAFGLLPTKPCQFCEMSDWIRVALRDERKVKLENEKLQIRGEERKYVNH